jgi:hypothetical protein
LTVPGGHDGAPLWSRGRREPPSGFRTRVDGIREQLPRLLERMRDAVEARSGRAERASREDLAAAVLEAHCRKYLIDPMLEALGWELCNPAEVLVEEGVESTAPGAERRFLDYHGRATAASDCASLVLVEAKRLSARLPVLQNPRTGRTLSTCSAMAKIMAVTAKRAEATTKPIPNMNFEADWREWLGTLRDYLDRLEQTRAGLPKLAVITNGEWYVLFKVPAQLLGREEVREESIVVFESLDDVLTDLASFHGLLGHASLSDRVGPYIPEAIGRFAVESKRPQLIVALLALWGRAGPVQPSMVLRPVAIMPRDRGPPLRFQLNLPHPYLNLQADPSLMALVFEKLGEQLHLLREACDAAAGPDGCEWLSLEDYWRLWPDSALGFDAADEGFLLLTGGPVTFLLDQDDFDACPFHAWSASQAVGRAATLRPVAASSREPPSFFDDGSPWHCAHSAVRDGKKQRCLIPEDRHICCRRCIYFAHCWNSDRQVLPCLRGTDRTAAVEAVGSAQ